jgi:hypothetical protein
MSTSIMEPFVQTPAFLISNGVKIEKSYGILKLSFFYDAVKLKMKKKNTQ